MFEYIIEDKDLNVIAKILKDHCAETRNCFNCIFRVEYEQGDESFCGCKLEHGTADFSMKCRPENWEV